MKNIKNRLENIPLIYKHDMVETIGLYVSVYI